MHDVPFTSSFHNVILRFCYKAPRRERKYRRRPRFQARYSSRAHHVTDKWSPGAGGQSVSQSVSQSEFGRSCIIGRRRRCPWRDRKSPFRIFLQMCGNKKGRRGTRRNFGVLCHPHNRGKVETPTLNYAPKSCKSGEGRERHHNQHHRRGVAVDSAAPGAKLLSPPRPTSRAPRCAWKTLTSQKWGMQKHTKRHWLDYRVLHLPGYLFSVGVCFHNLCITKRARCSACKKT